jgi:hypothetical protein
MTLNNQNKEARAMQAAAMRDRGSDQLLDMSGRMLGVR